MEESWGLQSTSLSFGQNVALSDFSLQALPGTVTVVLGGDGAGKTSALRSLVGLVPLDRGKAVRPPKAAIGYVPAIGGVYPDLTVSENLEFSMTAYKVDLPQFGDRIAVILNRIGLSGVSTRLAGQLSGGMKRKLAVGVALVHRPSLLVLDEPTTGVDPLSRFELWRLLAAEAASGVAVVVSTTYVNEAMHGSRVHLIHRGRTILTGSPAEVITSIAGRLGEVPAGSVPDGAGEGRLPTWPRGKVWSVWSPSDLLPVGSEPREPDLYDSTIVAELVAEGVDNDRTGGTSTLTLEDWVEELPGPRPSREPVSERRKTFGGEPILAEAVSLTVRFGATVAVSGAVLTVRRGEIVGLLGANGAGKTTLLHALLGLIGPSEGSARLFGSAPSPTARRRLGYVPQTMGLYSDMTVQENWDFTTSAFRIVRKLDAELTRYAGQPVGDLPLGIQRKGAFAIAFSHRPELLILDEPTSGVSPLGAARLWGDIKKAAAEAVGVLVTTHNMEEAEQCDRLVIMADGIIVVEGTAEAITRGHQVTEVNTLQWEEAFTLLTEAGYPAQVQGATIRVAGAEDKVKAILANSPLATQTRRVAASLEEVFLETIRADGPRG